MVLETSCAGSAAQHDSVKRTIKHYPARPFFSVTWAHVKVFGKRRLQAREVPS